ncbi:hypothetical protein AX774_g3405, partial [Zancudomyces culisetae]
MVKSTLALLTATVATLSVNAAANPRPRLAAGSMQPRVEQVHDLGRFPPPARPAFNRRFAAPAYRKRAEEEEDVPVDDSASAQDGAAQAQDGSAQNFDALTNYSDESDITDDRFWFG